MEVVIDAPYQNVIILLREADLLKNWVPLVTESDIINNY